MAYQTIFRSRPASAVRRFRLELVEVEDDLACPPFNAQDPAAVRHFAWRAVAPYRHREVAGAIFVDGDYTVIGCTLAYLGVMSRVAVEPRELFVPGLLLNAAGLILFHNHPHPSSSRPSAADLEVTEWLRDAGEVLGLRVLDHLVVGVDARDVTSIRDTGQVRLFRLGEPVSLPRLGVQDGHRDRRRFVRPKYRDPADLGNTWSGRGSTAKWLRAYLEAGWRLEDFEILPNGQIGLDPDRRQQLLSWIEDRPDRDHRRASRRSRAAAAAARSPKRRMSSR